MAPSPETDNTPKAPDKTEKSKSQKEATRGAASEAAAADIDKNLSVEKLDDDGLKALLDELATYRTPKDREGKSLLFKTLLTDAEDAIRKEHARSASGPELARYYNTSAKGRHRNKRQPSSISENLTHGGSLNDLAKEELYESVSYLQRPKKTVSARQREGGSLPCNVNAGASYDKQFFLEEQAKRKSTKDKPEYTSIDMEADMLIENESLNSVEFSESRSDSSGVEYGARVVPNIYTSKATLQIGNVDDGVIFPGMDRVERGLSAVAGGDEIQRYLPDAAMPKFSLYPMTNAIINRKSLYEEKKIDENGNALGQNTVNDIKKRKKAKKVEDVMKAEDVEGHRGDIIGNIDELVKYISGDDPKGSTKNNKLQKHVSEDKGKQHKHRTRSSKSSKTSEMQKSNSLEEISTSKMNDFHFDSETKAETPKLPLRSTKSNTERAARERKTPTAEQNASVENLESSDFTYVTKKKKSKKRRNSLGSKKQGHSNEGRSAEFDRVPSPHRKFACSVPHSEKSNDSSDTDSVHSLPVDSANNEQGNVPISYADIAKCADKPKVTKPIEEKKSPLSPPIVTPQSPPFKETIVVSSPPKVILENKNKAEMNSLDNNWPEIRNNKVNAVKNLESAQDWPSIQNNGLKPMPNNDNKVKTTPVSVNKNKPINNKSINKPPPKQEPIEVVTPKTPPQPITEDLTNNIQQVVQIPDPNQQNIMVYPYQLPPNIRDVQSIEKMQLKNLQANNNFNHNHVEEKIEETPAPVPPVIETCKRPAVVILSGADKHVSDITFGFDINEQLLNGDVCSDFISRFYLPEVPKSSQFDKLINYIGSEWEETVVQIHSGKVKYFSDSL